MFLNVVSLLIGFLALFVVLLMLLNRRTNGKTNGYLIAILIVVGIQRFLYAIEALGFTTQTYSPLKIKPVLAFFIIPIYYLFFCRLIDGKGKLKKDLLHFILPTLLVLMNLVYINYGINRIIYLCFSTLYFAFILHKIKQFLFKKNLSMLEKINYQAIKNWLVIMITVAFLLIVYTNCFLFQDFTTVMNLSLFYQYSSLVWLALLLYMFKNPVIIFGEYTLAKNISLDEPKDFQIWSTKPLKRIDDRDEIVSRTLSNKVETIIQDIRTKQQDVSLISSITLTTHSLAKELKIPKRHLDFIFKYYCHYSVSDFSNLVKVSYALSLIGQGYLQKFTVDSLGQECLFNSRFTFSKNFKKFVGVSVSDFVSAGNNNLFVKNISEN